MKMLWTITSFILCISNAIGQNADCIDAMKICELRSYQIDQLPSSGNIQDISTPLNCSGNQNFYETNSFWFEWTVEEAGTVAFVIDPIKKSDDIDFVVFEKTLENCESLIEMRCMASGIEAGANLEQSTPCMGSTGLSYSSMDEFEKSGCKYEDDNYLKLLSTEKGKTYYLLVNNYMSTSGFNISFDGTSELKPTEQCDHGDILSALEIVNIFPNPARNTLNVQYNSLNDDDLQWEFMDFSGKLFKINKAETSEKDQLTFDVSTLPSSGYLLRLSSGDNSVIKSFIKS